MHIEAFLIFTGLILAMGSLIGMRSESAAARRERRILRHKSRRKIVDGATGR